MWKLILDKLKRYKIAIGVFLVILVVVSLLFKDNKEIQSLFPTPAPVLKTPPPQTSTDITQPISETYFINSTTSLTPVTGYTWVGETLYYSTNQGFFEAGTNSVVFNKPNTDVRFSATGLFLYKDENGWNLLNVAQKQVTPLGKGDFEANINPQGTFIIFTTSNRTTLFDVNKKTEKEKAFNGSIQKTVWKSNSSSVFFQLTGTKVQEVDLNNFSDKSSFDLLPNTTLEAVSPIGDIKVTKENNTLKMVGPNTNYNIELLNNSTVQVTWTNPTYFLFIENYKDEVQRTINNIWSVNGAGQKTFLTSTKAIPRRINSQLPLYANTTNKAIALVERQAGLWLLSLIPNQYPFYDNTGLGFFSPPKSGDSHDETGE